MTVIICALLNRVPWKEKRGQALRHRWTTDEGVSAKPKTRVDSEDRLVYLAVGIHGSRSVAFPDAATHRNRRLLRRRRSALLPHDLRRRRQAPRPSRSSRSLHAHALAAQIYGV